MNKSELKQRFSPILEQQRLTPYVTSIICLSSQLEQIKPVVSGAKQEVLAQLKPTIRARETNRRRSNSKLRPGTTITNWENICYADEPDQNTAFTMLNQKLLELYPNDNDVKNGFCPQLVIASKIAQVKFELCKIMLAVLDENPNRILSVEKRDKLVNIALGLTLAYNKAK